MDTDSRNSREREAKVFRPFILFAIFTLGSLLSASPASAEVASWSFEPVRPVTKPSDGDRAKNDSNEEDEFPESHFGSAPRTQIGPGPCIKREGRGARRPAGLEFTSQTNQDPNFPNRPSAQAGGQESSGALESPESSSQHARDARDARDAKDAKDAKDVKDTCIEAPGSSTAETPLVPGMSNRNGIQEVALIASDLGYFPKTVFVSRDIPVKIFITGASKHALCIMVDAFQIRKQVRSQKIEEIEFTPTEAGQFRFYCPVNGMEGMIFVRDMATIVDHVPVTSGGGISNPFISAPVPSVSLPEARQTQKVQHQPRTENSEINGRSEQSAKPEKTQSSLKEHTPGKERPQAKEHVQAQSHSTSPSKASAEHLSQPSHPLAQARVQAANPPPIQVAGTSAAPLAKEKQGE